MYYFGTNLDEKFAVPDFWPKKDETHKIPYDRKEIEEELERLKARRLAARARRLDIEGHNPQPSSAPREGSAILQSLQHQENITPVAPTNGSSSTSTGWFSSWR
ncbi:hypothetical protein ANO11243_017300 [Dothideomycetidae sp. 11243]|nr:hypothetical protein ANO11243_017300 [fungal sp. No.11243]